MASDLDKKLEEIIRNTYDVYEDSDVVETTKRVKQAFKDAGWVEKINDGFEKGHAAGYHMAELEYQAVGYVGRDLKPGMLTGQEWYARFEKEMDSIDAYATFDNHDDVDKTLKAAKKAAGIE